jgi:hypothetical protein
VGRGFVALRSALDKSTFDMSVVVIERNIMEPKSQTWFCFLWLHFGFNSLCSVRRGFVALRSALEKSTFDMSVVVIERNIVESKSLYSEVEITCKERSRNQEFCSFSRSRKSWVAFLSFEKGMVARVLLRVGTEAETLSFSNGFWAA